jgi:hypothetical protein
MENYTIAIPGRNASLRPPNNLEKLTKLAYRRTISICPEREAD